LARCWPTIWWVDRPRISTSSHRTPAEVTQLTQALAVALRAEDAQVRVDWRGPGFSRLAVTVADGRSVVVEVARDARIRQAVQLSFGWVLHPDEVAAEKTLALFGRAAARDLVDVAALSERRHKGRGFRLSLPYGRARLAGGPNCWMPRVCQPGIAVQSFGGRTPPGSEAPGSEAPGSPSSPTI
jgi:hypothetical protein